MVEFRNIPQFLVDLITKKSCSLLITEDDVLRPELPIMIMMITVIIPCKLALTYLLFTVHFHFSVSLSLVFPFPLFAQGKEN